MNRNNNFNRNMNYNRNRQYRQNYQRVQQQSSEPVVVDYGPNPFVADLSETTLANEVFRRALWTGEHLQLTLMTIPVGGEIGLEIHPHLDQFLYIEQGEAEAKMGAQKDQFTTDAKVYKDSCIIIPANTWHNVVNTGEEDLKLFSIYAQIGRAHV